MTPRGRLFFFEVSLNFGNFASHKAICDVFFITYTD